MGLTNQRTYNGDCRHGFRRLGFGQKMALGLGFRVSRFLEKCCVQFLQGFDRNGFLGVYQYYSSELLI